MNPERFERRLLRRFFDRVVVGAPRSDGAGPCWFWRGGHNKGGYAKFSVGTSTVYAHRWAHERFRGTVPDALQLDHVVCDRAGCVNPWHTEPATPRANTLRGTSPSAVNARKIECLRGHPFDEANTYWNPTGGRSCRCCRRDRMRRRRL